MAETERSIHDALMIVKRARAQTSIVGGGGAIEMELSKHLRQYGKTIKTKLQHVVLQYARAFEIIPKLLASNAGYDSTDIVSQLRAAHYDGKKTACINMKNGTIGDASELGIVESLKVKSQMLLSAHEAGEMILRVDEVVKAPPRKRERDPRYPH